MLPTMSKMYSYKFRIYPTLEQQQTLAQWFGCTRKVYNHYLHQRIQFFHENKDAKKRGLSYNDNATDLPRLKTELEWLNECPSQALQQSLKHLDKAYANFFSRRADFPTPKKRKHTQALHFPQGFKVLEGHIQIPKMKTPIKAKFHRSIEGDVRSIVVTKTAANNYHVSILVEKEMPCKPKVESEVGIDLGLHDFLVASDGTKAKTPKYLRKSQRKLVKLSRQLAKKKKGSNNRAKKRLKLARLHEHIANQRKDFAHKLSHTLISDNQAVYFEDLSIKGMMQNHKLAKSVADAGWSQFVNFVEYKAGWYGRKVFKIDKWFPSSKMCHKCFCINDKLTLKHRKWTCPSCGMEHDRDLNASINILRAGQQLSIGEDIPKLTPVDCALSGVASAA